MVIIFFLFLQYARPQMLAFMFRHGHNAEACSLFFPSSQPTTEGETSLSLVPHNDPLTTDYGTVDDLCDLCLGYGAMSVLENTIASIMQSPTYHDILVIQYMNTVLTRICNYCETHRHFSYLYNFLVLQIPLFMIPLDLNSSITFVLIISNNQTWYGRF
jgi:zinc finger FYVE domain-containing protein 26